MNEQTQYITEEISLAEFSERFLCNNDFTTPDVYDCTDLNIEVLTLDKDGNEHYVPIRSFVVKESVNQYYTDGRLKGTSEHRVVENGKEIHLKDHPDFKVVNAPMQVVDIEVDSEEHTYLANGRLNHNTTSGGKAIPFHASVRLRLKSVGQIKVKDNIIGIKTRAQVIKNRMGPPLKSVDYDIYFESGIDDFGGWLNVMKDYGIVKQAGAWYTYVNKETGEEVKFQSKDFESTISSNPELYDMIYKEICDAYILRYNPGVDIGIDDIEISDDLIPED